MPSRNAPLLELLDQAYGSKRAWHGTALRGALRGVTPGRALRRPGPGRHNIWELVLHIAYWKYAVTQLLTGGRARDLPPDPVQLAGPARAGIRAGLAGRPCPARRPAPGPAPCGRGGSPVPAEPEAAAEDPLDHR